MHDIYMPHQLLTRNCRVYQMDQQLNETNSTSDEGNKGYTPPSGQDMNDTTSDAKVQEGSKEQVSANAYVAMGTARSID